MQLTAIQSGDSALTRSFDITIPVSLTTVERSQERETRLIIPSHPSVLPDLALVSPQVDEVIGRAVESEVRVERGGLDGS